MAVRASVRIDHVYVLVAECHSELYSLLQSVNSVQKETAMNETFTVFTVFTAQTAWPLALAALASANIR